MADIDSTNEPSLSAIDALETADTKLAQLDALLMMTYGEARVSFESMNETLRENFMWACNDLAIDCRKLVGVAHHKALAPGVPRV